MNTATNTIIDGTETPEWTGLPNFDLMWGYKSIDVPIQNEAQRFEFSMLKLARILTKRVEERRDFSAAKVSKYLNKYSNILRPYSTKEIREKLSLRHLSLTNAINRRISR